MENKGDGLMFLDTFTEAFEMLRVHFTKNKAL